MRRFLIRIGLLKFKIGDRVKPNPRIFYSWYRIVEGQDYAIVKEVSGKIIRVEGHVIPFLRNELILY